MAQNQNDSDQDKDESSSTPPSAPAKPLRDVVVRHLDEPPSLGKQTIHPRRPAPTVPTREERMDRDSNDDNKKETE